ncbi:hypothetical protein ACJ2A9_21435 [Anaerobacillus sp. MEB173]|uniref:hypothetical protein n=1 Tax=Anaerobacillus sp. MEB173 TaxID=3383345 RepID=UPI003F8DB82B
MNSVKSMGKWMSAKVENIAPSFVELSDDELIKKFKDFKNRYKTAKENYEFTEAEMLLGEIKIIKKELKRRNVTR